MTEPNQTTDEAGITRTETGEISNETKGTSEASNQNTNQETTPERTTLLNQAEKKEEKVEAATDKKGDEAKDKAEGKAPEKYESFKVPEGYEIPEKVMTEVSALFKEMGLSQDQAQKLIDFQTKMETEAGDAPYKAWDEMKSGWRRDAENHPDLKGKLAADGEVTVRIGKFLNQLDPKLANDFRDLMELTGAGDHPAFIRVIDYAAKKLTESGSHVAGNGPAAPGQSRDGQTRQPSAAEAMWPNLAR